MSVRVEEVGDGTEWNELLAGSRGGSPFHRYEFLETCARHGDATVHPYVGYKGEEPIGLFPVLEARKGPFTAAFSPPPDLKVPYLGPAPLNAGKLKRGKRERRNRRFVEAVLDRVDREFGPRFVNVRTSPDYDDERPFVWAGYDATPRYTYVLDLTENVEDLRMALNSGVRKSVRERADGFEIAEADLGDVERIIEGAARRHAEKGADYNVTPSFVTDLHDALPDGMVRAHVCRHDGEFCGGEVSLEYDGTVYGWQSYGDLSRSVPVYDLMYWHIFRAAKERGCTAYDLLGANNPDLCRYKAKFSPELRKYQALNRATLDMKAAAKVYKRLR
ncbi:GNAT family N-acetyltransferase [Halorarum halobium]|uniref:GNAT family N-acetyltransferase n=1 Tax=Halorarum halobium TaxID=3075121 RepID=UPI0028B05A23|nr:GNAT family N-acetyltransferase [Halobaculum sp. XH14]